MMLVLMLMVAASIKTLDLKIKANAYSVGLRKEPSLLAANMVTKLLWFMRPSAVDIEDQGRIGFLSLEHKRIEY